MLSNGIMLARWSDSFTLTIGISNRFGNETAYLIHTPQDFDYGSSWAGKTFRAEQPRFTTVEATK